MVSFYLSVTVHRWKQQGCHPESPVGPPSLSGENEQAFWFRVDPLYVSAEITFPNIIRETEVGISKLEALGKITCRLKK